MKVLLFTNRKGGVGKTTVSLLTAVYLSKIGKKVLYVDGDISQADGIRWALGREDFESTKIYDTDYGFDIVWAGGAHDIQMINSNGKLYDYIVIDGRPSDYVCAYFGKYAHRIIVPFMKSVADIQGSRSYLSFLKKMGSQGKAIFFYNKWCGAVRKGWHWADDLYVDYLTENIKKWVKPEPNTKEG